MKTMKSRKRKIARKWKNKENSKIRSFNGIEGELSCLKSFFFSERFCCNRCGKIHNSGYEYSNGIKLCVSCKNTIRPNKKKIIYTPMGNER